MLLAQFAPQVVPVQQVHKGVAGAASAGEAQRPLWWLEATASVLEIIRFPQEAPGRAQRTGSTGV